MIHLRAAYCLASIIRWHGGSCNSGSMHFWLQVGKAKMRFSTVQWGIRFLSGISICWVVNFSKPTTTYCLFPLLLLWKLLALLTMMMTRKEKSTKEWRDGTTNFKEHRAHNCCSEAEASPPLKDYVHQIFWNLVMLLMLPLLLLLKMTTWNKKVITLVHYNVPKGWSKLEFCPLNIEPLKNMDILPHLVFFFSLFFL